MDSYVPSPHDMILVKRHRCLGHEYWSFTKEPICEVYLTPDKWDQLRKEDAEYDLPYIERPQDRGKYWWSIFGMRIQVCYPTYPFTEASRISEVLQKDGIAVYGNKVCF